MRFYAHSQEGRSPEEWQALEEHLKNVAELAMEFARPFGGEEWAFIAGLWHDLGKYSDAFQKKLYDANGIECHIETQPGRVIHSEAGGHLASLKGWKGVDRILSWLIMGHHAGLTDFHEEHVAGKALRPKMEQPKKSKYILDNVPNKILNHPLPAPPQPLLNDADPAFYIRMLFSCLVDADFLDTEKFMDKGRSGLRNEYQSEITELSYHFDRYMNALCEKATPSPVNKIRAEVLALCRRAAEEPQAVFSLCVPTGGGKTLSSLAFALRHAVHNGKKRIIYVIPYTSIIEQTADVFRRIPGFENAVLEHHSNVAEMAESQESVRSRLAAENWDAPVIVTTSVQFFESLFACRTSRCRKLHNIANSVVIFDEAQCLPHKYLRPAVFAIRELFRYYRVTPLLCTATQPVLTRTEEFDFKFKEGFDTPPKEIVEKPDQLAKRLKRVNLELHNPEMNPVGLKELAEILRAEKSALLCIVNRRDDARNLVRLMQSETSLHLSTNMCAVHRFKVLEKIKERVRAGEEIIVISTSLIEAGVDLDFPIVYRAMAGLDSIAQAAGRCNREGALEKDGRKIPGRTVVYVPEKQPGYVRQSAGITLELLKGELNELLLPANYEKYFRQIYWQLGEDSLDKEKIMQLASGRKMDFYFRTAAERFRLIDDHWQETVVVPYGKAVQLVGRLTAEPWNQRNLLRLLGRYSISLPHYLFNTLVEKEYIRETGYPGLYMLDRTLYDEDKFGFVPPDEAVAVDPEKFML